MRMVLAQNVMKICLYKMLNVSRFVEMDCWQRKNIVILELQMAKEGKKSFILYLLVALLIAKNSKDSAV